jgi:hypothetical protein
MRDIVLQAARDAEVPAGLNYPVAVKIISRDIAQSDLQFGASSALGH